MLKSLIIPIAAFSYLLDLTFWFRELILMQPDSGKNHLRLFLLDRCRKSVRLSLLVCWWLREGEERECVYVHVCVFAFVYMCMYICMISLYISPNHHCSLSCSHTSFLLHITLMFFSSFSPTIKQTTWLLREEEENQPRTARRVRMGRLSDDISQSVLLRVFMLMCIYIYLLVCTYIRIVYARERARPKYC